MFETPTTSIAITFIIIISTTFIYRRWIRPYRNYCLYKKIISNSYTVLIHPFTVLGLGILGMARRDYKKYGDGQYTIMHEYPKYQVGLANFKDRMVVELIDPSLIKQCYERQAEGYYIKTLIGPFTSSLKHLIGSGLMFSQGQEWKMKKKIMSQVFNYDFIKSKIAVIAQICAQNMDEAQQEESNKDKASVKIDLNNLFQRIFGTTVVKCFFGNIQLDKIEGTELFAYVNRIFQLNTERTLTFFAFIIGPTFHKYNLRKIDRQANDKIQKFKQFARKAIIQQIQKVKKEGNTNTSNKYNGIVDLLIKQNKLQALSEKQQQKEYYTVSDLIDEFTTFFSAGTDTTTNSTSMLIYLLAQHTDVQAKVRKEIDVIFPSPLNIGDVTYENLKKLVYLEDAMKETLRMYSPTAGILPRQATKDHYIGSIPIKKGTIITVRNKPNQYKDQYFPNPFVFRPERWSERDPTKNQPFSYFPFSAGQRICIGQHLSLIQSKIAVVLLLKRYGKITLGNPHFKMYMRTLYGPEQMTTTFQKHQI